MKVSTVTEEKLQWLKDTLAKSPHLTRAHFWKCGYSYPYLDKLEADGIVKFGKAKSKTGGWR